MVNFNSIRIQIDSQCTIKYKIRANVLYGLYQPFERNILNPSYMNANSLFSFGKMDCITIRL